MSDTDPDKLNEWSTLFITVAGALTGMVGVLVGGWKWCKRLVRAVRLSDSWHYSFGDRPVDAIVKLHRIGYRCNSIAELQRELISERLSLGFYVCDPSGNCVWSNSVLQHMLGLDSQQMLGFGWLSTVIEKAAVHEEWLQSIERRIPYDSEFSVRTTNGIRRARSRAFTCLRHHDNAEIPEMLAYVGYIEWVE